MTICYFGFGIISCQKENKDLLISSSSKTPPKDISYNLRTNYPSTKFIEDESIKGDFEVRGETLHFKNAESFFKTLEKFSSMTIEERINTSKSFKLLSLLEIQNNFISEIEKIDSKDKSEQILKKYNDILSKNQNYIGFKNIDKVSAGLINRKGIVYIGKSLRCYKGLEIIDIESGNESLLNENPSSLVKKYQYLTPIDDKSYARTLTTCSRFAGTMSNGNNTQYNCANCFNGGGNRAVVLEIYAKTSVNGNGTITVTPYAIGNAWRTYWWGGPNSWYPYKTNNDLGAHWQCIVTSNNGQTLSSVANSNISNNNSFIDFSGTSMLFTNNPTSFSTAFNFSYNGNSFYNSGGVLPPGVVASCL